MDVTTPTKEHRRRESLRRIITSTSDDGILAASSPLTATTDGGRSDSKNEPKSEYLRKALQDRKDARSRPKPADEPSMTPEPIDTVTLRRRARTPSPVRNLPSPEPSLVGDEWTRDVLEDERPARSRAPATVRKPRRSSATGLRTAEASPFAGTPSKDTQAKLDRLSNENFNLKHRLTLQQDQVKQLVDKLELALEEIKALKKAEEEKSELNKKLEQELVELEVELDDREAEIEQLHVERTELFSLQEELAKEMEKRDEAIDEATEMIMQAEEECERVKAELEGLKLERAASATPAPKEIDSDYYSAETERDSPWRHARPKESIDSKLSAGLSDYYSGPNSPYVQPHAEPLPAVPPHLIPAERVPERKLGPLSQRARTIAQQKSISSARLRTRISCASEATESVVDSVDINGSTPSLSRRLQGQALPLIRQHSSEFDLPAISEAPKTRRGTSFRQRASAHGLRALFQKGESASPTRLGRTLTIGPVVENAASVPSSPVLHLNRATSSHSDPNHHPSLLGVRPVTREGSINTISTVSTVSTGSTNQLDRHSTTTPDRNPRQATADSYRHIRQPSTDPRPQHHLPQQHSQLPPPYIQQPLSYRTHQGYPTTPTIKPPPTTPTAYPGATSFYHSTSTINSQLVDSPCLTPSATGSSGGARDFFFNPHTDFSAAVATATELVGGGSVEGLSRVPTSRSRRRFGE